MEQTFYEYHHAIIGGRMIWRACKNEHRVEQLQSPTHVHIARDDIAIASAEVDFAEVLRAVRNRVPPGLDID
ncbi:MAG: hypothetical protein ACRDWF_10300 [Acidimicrobiia bacterium]|jgi:hypothetical protein